MATDNTTSGNRPGRYPAVFLDRDGTLNRQVIREGKPYPPQTVADFTLFDGVPEACAKLARAGFVLVVATNQPDVGRGTQAQAVVEAMHARLQQLVPEIARIEVCYAPGTVAGGARTAERSELAVAEPVEGGQARPFATENRRRKPEPGMLLDAAAALGLDLSRSWMVGDRWRDIDCGKRAGVRTVFIDFGYAETLHSPPDYVVKSLVEAADVIVNAH